MTFRYSGAGWRVAKSIETFGDQIMDLRGHTTTYPSDGTLGNREHSNRTSDHNPDNAGIVRALDFYEQTPGFVDAVAESVRASRDIRLKYFIHNTRFFSSYATTTRKAWEWGPYTGPNGHQTHGHLSVVGTIQAELPQFWTMPTTTIPSPNPIPEESPMWQYLNISESLVRHASAEGWFKKPDGTPDRTEATIKYYVDLLPELQKSISANPDWLNFRRAITNGIALQKATAGTAPDLTGYSKVGHGHIAKTTVT